MTEFYEALQLLQLFVFLGLGIAALIHWRRRRDEAAAWLAGTFVALAVVVLAGRFIPQDSESGLVQLIVKVEIAILVLFPYFLYRFMTSFRAEPRWRWIVAHALTAAIVLATFALPAFPQEGEPRTAIFQAYIYLLLAQWVFLTSVVAVALWRSGRGQPTVARRRMQTLSLGAAGMALALVISGTQTPEIDPATMEPVVTVATLITGLLALATGPLFLFGFAPPRVVRMLWRRPEEEALREAELGLMRVMDAEEVASVLLPHASNLVGGRGAVLAATNGSVIGSYGLDAADAQEIAAALAHEQSPSGEEPVLQVPMAAGWLAVKATSYTPYFGTEETGSLSSLAVLADLALARGSLFHELKRSNEDLERFAYVASHDLQEPLRIVAGYVELLQRRYADAFDDDGRQFMSYIGDGATRMQQMIRDLLAFARVSSGAQPLAPVDTTLAVEAAMANLERKRCCVR